MPLLIENTKINCVHPGLLGWDPEAGKHFDRAEESPQRESTLQSCDCCSQIGHRPLARETWVGPCATRARRASRRAPALYGAEAQVENLELDRAATGHVEDDVAGVQDGCLDLRRTVAAAVVHDEGRLGLALVDAVDLRLDVSTMSLHPTDLATFARPKTVTLGALARVLHAHACVLAGHQILDLRARVRDVHGLAREVLLFDCPSNFLCEAADELPDHVVTEEAGGVALAIDGGHFVERAGWVLGGIILLLVVVQLGLETLAVVEARGVELLVRVSSCVAAAAKCAAPTLSDSSARFLEAAEHGLVEREDAREAERQVEAAQEKRVRHLSIGSRFLEASAALLALQTPQPASTRHRFVA